MRDVRLVIVHRPGPRWQHGRPIPEQPGVQAHIEHYRELLEDGRLEWGGPFLDEHAGGMMILVSGTSEEDAQAIAACDPSVQAGLLTYEIRTWMIGMRKGE